jgi:hypothetical protein
LTACTVLRAERHVREPWLETAKRGERPREVEKEAGVGAAQARGFQQATRAGRRDGNRLAVERDAPHDQPRSRVPWIVLEQRQPPRRREGIAQRSDHGRSVRGTHVMEHAAQVAKIEPALVRERAGGQERHPGAPVLLARPGHGVLGAVDPHHLRFRNASRAGGRVTGPQPKSSTAGMKRGRQMRAQIGDPPRTKNSRSSPDSRIPWRRSASYSLGRSNSGSRSLGTTAPLNPRHRRPGVSSIAPSHDGLKV